MGIHFSLAFSFSCPRGNLCEYQIATGHRTCETHGEQCWVQVDILSGVFRDCIHLAQNHHISNYTWRTRRKGREGYIWCEGYLMSYLWCSIPIFYISFHVIPVILKTTSDTSRSILSIYATIYPGSYQSSLMWRMSTPASLCSSSPQPSERQRELFNGNKCRTYLEKPGNRH